MNAKPVRNGDRELTAGFTLDYDQANEIDIKSYGEDLDVKLTFAAAPQGGATTPASNYTPRAVHFAELAVPPISGGGSDLSGGESACHTPPHRVTNSK